MPMDQDLGPGSAAALMPRYQQHESGIKLYKSELACWIAASVALVPLA
jgi:hypothetical protein